MTQSLLWSQTESNKSYAELCNALYERELAQLATMAFSNASQVQARIKSLPYYVQRTAYRLSQTTSPLTLDIQNASWVSKQPNKPPISDQSLDVIREWYQPETLQLGLVIPIQLERNNDESIVLDSIDRIDAENNRFRSNYFGWFNLNALDLANDNHAKLLKPNKKVMSAACCGHRWNSKGKSGTVPLMLRELLLTCGINWQNYKKVC